MLAPVIEKNRCWRLEYADDVNFHLDTLPYVGEDSAIAERIGAMGVPLVLAAVQWRSRTSATSSIA